MTSSQTTEELVKIFTDSLVQWRRAIIESNNEGMRLAKKIMASSFKELKKRDKKLTALVNLIESPENDITRMVTARWLLGINDEKALRVLDEIANKHKQGEARFAGKIAKEWREQCGTNNKRYQYYKIIMGMIIVVGIARVFSYLFRDIYYDNPIGYFSVLNSFLLIIGTVWLYSQKDKAGYYFALFYFFIKLLGGSTYFYLKSPSIFHQMITIPHVAISGFTELTYSYISAVALYILIINSNFSLKDYSRSRVDEVRKISQFKNYFKD